MGLLLFFKKATVAERQEMVLKSTVEVMEKADEVAWNEARQAAETRLMCHLRDKGWKQNQRKNLNAKEIANGLRSTGGTKKRVCTKQLVLSHADQPTGNKDEARGPTAVRLGC